MCIKLVSAVMVTNPTEPRAVESATEQGMAVLQVVQAMVADSMKTAMSSVTHELLEAVDRHIAAQTAAAAPRTGPGESSMGIVSLPSVRQLPSTASLVSMPVLSAGTVRCIENMTVIPFYRLALFVVIAPLTVNIFDYLLAFNR